MRSKSQIPSKPILMADLVRFAKTHSLECAKGNGQSLPLNPSLRRKYFNPQRKIFIDPSRVPITLQDFFKGNYSFMPHKKTKTKRNMGRNGYNIADDIIQYALAGLTLLSPKVQTNKNRQRKEFQ